MQISAVDQAVIAQGLIAAAREMGAKLIRSAYSPIVREAVSSRTMNRWPKSATIGPSRRS